MNVSVLTELGNMLIADHVAVFMCHKLKECRALALKQFCQYIAGS
jgi:hypothetical protein